MPTPAMIDSSQRSVREPILRGVGYEDVYAAATYCQKLLRYRSVPSGHLALLLN